MAEEVDDVAVAQLLQQLDLVLDLFLRVVASRELARVELHHVPGHLPPRLVIKAPVNNLEAPLAQFLGELRGGGRRGR